MRFVKIIRPKMIKFMEREARYVEFSGEFRNRIVPLREQEEGVEQGG